LGIVSVLAFVEIFLPQVGEDVRQPTKRPEYGGLAVERGARPTLDRNWPPEFLFPLDRERISPNI
jgi:hypothetical protein